MVLGFFVGVQIQQLHGCTENDFAFRVDFFWVDDLRVGEFVFQFGNAAFNEALFFFGGFVFGILGQIAVRARFGNGFDNGGACNAFEFLQFCFELFCTVYG